jgi:hypothetical protein
LGLKQLVPHPRRAQRLTDCRCTPACRATSDWKRPGVCSGGGFRLRKPRALIEEEFGDGIMRAIDFLMDIQRETNPSGDRVKLNLSGKFLPYKRHQTLRRQNLFLR